VGEEGGEIKNIIMAQIAGTTIKREISGYPNVRIDLLKRHEFIPLLEEKGVTEYKKEVSGTIPRGSISSEKFWKEGFKIVDQLCDKYGIV